MFWRLSGVGRASASGQRGDCCRIRATSAARFLSPKLSPAAADSDVLHGRNETRWNERPTREHSSVLNRTRWTVVKSLMTRRSWVQIPPPPPSNQQVRGLSQQLGASLRFALSPLCRQGRRNPSIPSAMSTRRRCSTPGQDALMVTIERIRPNDGLRRGTSGEIAVPIEWHREHPQGWLAPPKLVGKQPGPGLADLPR